MGKIMARVPTNKTGKTTLGGKAMRIMIRTVMTWPQTRRGVLTVQCVLASHLDGWQTTSTLTELHKFKCVLLFVVCFPLFVCLALC